MTVIVMKLSEKLTRYFAGRGAGYWISPAAIVFAVVAICLYASYGVTDFNPEIDAAAIICAAVGAALGLVSMFVDLIPLSFSELFVKPLRYISFLVIFYAFIRFIGSQATYIANVFVAIDGNSFSAAFICMFIFYLLSAVAMLLAGSLICVPIRRGAVEKTAEVNEGE